MAPVSGGMSASVTISSSSMVVSVVTWSLCGRTGAVWHGAMPSADVRVLLGISSAGSMSSCFMISSASIAWPGESEPGVAGHKWRSFGWKTPCRIFVEVKRPGWFHYYLPAFVAGEKKLKTGEKMVPSRVVRGGLPVASELSSLPLGLMGLLVHVIVSEKNVRSVVTTEGNIRHKTPL